MAETFAPIMSVKGYFRKYGIEAIGRKKADKSLVRKQLLDDFKHEIFSQLAIHVGDAQMLARDVAQVDEETKRKVNNILNNSVRKWKRLCVVFSQYRETYNLILPSDLMVDLEDIIKGICEGEPTKEEEPNDNRTDGTLDEANTDTGDGEISVGAEDESNTD